MSSVIIAGNTSGSVTLSAPAISGSSVLTLPVATDTLVGKATTDTLTNKTLGSGTVMPTGSVIQVIQTLNNANTTGSTIIPNDNTIPQISEGTQYLTCTITPKSATSNLLVTVTLFISETANNSNNGIVALFRDATANALCAGYMGQSGSLFEQGSPSVLSFLTPASSTSSTTFTVRAGLDTAFALIMNSSTSAATPKLGGVYYSGITIMEIAA